MHHAARLGPVLVEVLSGAATAPPRDFEIDMTRVDDIDACGCQLLALFVEHLKRRGAEPLACGASGEVREKIRALGFDPETLGPAPEPGEAQA